MGNKSFIFRFGDFEVREREFSLVRAGEALQVEPKAFRALVFLLRNPQRLIPKEELVKSVWGETAVADGSVTRCIWLLRRLLGDDINEPRYIETVATVGYRFICPVEVSEEVQPNAVQPVDPPAAANPVPTDPAPADDTKKDTHRKRRPAWLLPAAGILALSLASVAWYLLRPLPQPHITGYTKITHDGRHKWLTGTDGTRLYINNYLDGTVAQVAISSGESKEIPIALKGPIFIQGVSPDGETLLVEQATDSTLWTTGTEGGSLRRLSDKPIETVACAPDGTSVFYTADNGDFYVMRSDGNDAHKLASAGGFVRDMAVSPDGKTIRYTKDDALWEMSSSGSTPHRLLPGWPASQGICCGRWTPDGDFFLFLVGGEHLTQSAALTAQIWALDERRRLFRQPPAEALKLTSDANGWSSEILSKDGRKIYARGVTPLGELLRFDTKTKLLQPYLGGISAEFLTFSPDGKSLAYVTFPEGILWRANRDGSGRIQMTDPPIYPILPRWSPDGRQILFFASSGLHGNDVMFVISAEGGKPQRLLPRENGQEIDPNWSPDGRKIVFWDGVHNDIRILDIASHQVIALPGSDGLFSPRWSPDGRIIAVFDPPKNRTKLFDIARQRWSTLVDMGPGVYIEWSPDSRYIYALCLGDDPGVCRINIEKNQLERVVDMKGFHFTGINSYWMGLDPSGAPLILRDAGLDDIYALPLEVK